ncbi:hypothetical protein FQZ97_911980 [compost metagenome]
MDAAVLPGALHTATGIAQAEAEGARVAAAMADTVCVLSRGLSTRMKRMGSPARG